LRAVRQQASDGREDRDRHWREFRYLSRLHLSFQSEVIELQMICFVFSFFFSFFFITESQHNLGLGIGQWEKVLKLVTTSLYHV
jgi:hypothetical protein